MNKNKVRVLHVVGQLEVGGISSWLWALLETADKNEMDIDICTNFRGGSGALAESFKSYGVNVYHIPMTINPYSYIKTMRELISARGYNVVHDHRSYLSGHTLKAAAQAGVGVRIMGHHAVNDERLPGFLRAIYEHILKRWALKYSTDIVGCSKAALSSHYGNAWKNSDKFKVVYASINPVPVPEDARKKIRKQLGIMDDEYVIGFVARMAEVKNPQICIKVMHELLKVRQDVVLLMVGDGPLLDKTKEDAVVMGCIEKVRFTGFVDNVPEYLQAIDIFFQPSLFEGFCLGKLEALNAGLPIVGSNVPGIAEGLPDEYINNLSDIFDVAAYVKNINRIINEGCKRSYYSDVLKNFSPSNFYLQLVDVYKKRLKLS